MNMINLNKADEKGLMKIIHIGKVRAKLIIEQRKNKLFRDIYELSIIPGLGKKRMKDIINQKNIIV
ncbi:MAG: helix-hairpin-helix domain-containing protein [Bacteroidales bacterium]|nr:helix-hairpin-helix domain-containing protein [Bacteroidales bacterium]